MWNTSISDRLIKLAIKEGKRIGNYLPKLKENQLS